jgi:hypothetical protein
MCKSILIYIYVKKPAVDDVIFIVVLAPLLAQYPFDYGDGEDGVKDNGGEDGVQDYGGEDDLRNGNDEQGG